MHALAQSRPESSRPQMRVFDDPLHTLPAGSPEHLEELRRQSQDLEGATPWEILQWGVENYFPKLTMATAFGPEGCVILHMLATIEPRVHVFNLDTGYQFKETLELRDRIR